MASARLLVWLGSAGLLAAALLRRLKRSSYDGLDGIVSFSSCIIAAARALESERSDAIVFDPLAGVLAGQKAMKQARVSFYAVCMSCDLAALKLLVLLHGMPAPIAACNTPTCVSRSQHLLLLIRTYLAHTCAGAAAETAHRRRNFGSRQQWR